MEWKLQKKMKFVVIVAAALLIAILFETGCSDRGEYYTGWTYSHEKAETPTDLEEHLKASVSEDMSLDQMLAAFEEMCQYPVEGVEPEDELLLFESGTYSFDMDEEPLFYFSVVRQFPNEDGEFYQIHLDVMYTPGSSREELEMSFWNDEVDENFFEYIRKTKVYQEVCNEPHIKVETYMDET